MGSANSDVERLLKIIDDGIKAGDLEKTAKYEQTRNKVRHLPEETKEAEEEVKKMDRAKANRKKAEGGMDDLKALILNK